MGLSLNLFPIDHLSSGFFGYSHTVLALGALSWDLGAKIKQRARRLPDGHDISSHFGEYVKRGNRKGARIYGRLSEDAYGEPYCWLTAKELLPFLKKHWPKHAVTAYVRAMPSNGMIVLDWH